MTLSNPKSKIQNPKSPVRLRPATAADQPTIRRMVRGARLNPRHLEWPNFVVAVDEGGTMVGCGQIRPHQGDVWELASLVTAEAWRGRGVAADIIHHLQAQHAQSHPNAPLWLMCASNLVPFYTPFGFAEVTNNPELPTHFGRMRTIARTIQWLFRIQGHLAVMVKRY